MGRWPEHEPAAEGVYNKKTWIHTAITTTALHWHPHRAIALSYRTCGHPHAVNVECILSLLP